jgi:hypothetical protein
MRRTEFEERVLQNQADAAMRRVLSELAPDTTDELHTL